MAAALNLLRGEPRARRFLIGQAQSALGTGAAYVALLVIAYERLRSPWAISLVLLADYVPATVLGPVLGAAVDRFGRRRCAVIAEAVRAVAFIALGFASSFALVLVLALIAGVGTALFRPAGLAGLPGMVDEENLPAAMSLYGAINDVGHVVGPALAAGVLAIAGPSAAMFANGATFAVSALIVASIDFGRRHAQPACGAARPSLLADAREGLSMTMGMPAVRTLMIASAIAVLCAGFMNVGELQLATVTLGAGNSGLALLVAICGAGVVMGSLSASGGGASPQLKRRYLTGLAALGVGVLAAGLAPGLTMAAVAFAVSGLGNGVAVAHEQLLVQRSAPGELLGRVFGVKSALISGAFGLSFLAGGALTSLLGPRGLFVFAGAGLLCAAAWAAVRLRDAWRAPEPASAAASATHAAAV